MAAAPAVEGTTVAWVAAAASRLAAAPTEPYARVMAVVAPVVTPDPTTDGEQLPAANWHDRLTLLSGNVTFCDRFRQSCQQVHHWAITRLAFALLKLCCLCLLLR